MSLFQSDFAAALLNPDFATPDGVVDPNGRAAGKRFDVYRNNVVHSLVEAMNISFPAIQKIVGAGFFDTMSGIYVRAYPPKVPIMMFYGSDFPTFLETFEPAAHLPYLADVARLELARRTCYHAADASPLDGFELANLSPEALMAATFTFVPAAILMKSDHPVHSIWHYNLVEPFKIINPNEYLLLARPELDVVPNVLDLAAYDFLYALQSGANLEAAYDTATNIDENFDLSAAIGLMMSARILQSIKS